MSISPSCNDSSLPYQLPISNELEESFIEALPDELIQNIFFSLNDSELGKCRQVCKRWQKLASDEPFLKILYSEPAIAFGKDKWKTYFTDVGKVPRLPVNINEILESSCPIWGKGGKKIKDTHILFYNPKEINAQPHTINNIGKLVTSPKEGIATGYRYIWEEIIYEHGNTPVKKGEWILMTKDVLPGSKNKTYTEQKALVEELSMKAQVEYLVPKSNEAITGIFTKYVSSGTRLYSDNPWTYTRCQEQTQGSHLAVGGFTSDGLHVTALFANGNYGIAAVRKL